MTQLLFLVVFAEAFVAFLLMVKIGPLRELVMNGIDQVKMRKGTVLTIAGTMSVILFSNWISIVKIQNKGAKIGTMTPMDQVLWRTHLLEASLMGCFDCIKYWDSGICAGNSCFKMKNGDAYNSHRFVCGSKCYVSKSSEVDGFSLYLGFLIDRMHHHLRKLINLRRNGGSSKKEVEKLTKEKSELQENERKAKEEIMRLQKEMSKLTENIQKLKSESEEKDKQVETAESHVASLQKQSADLLLEYDRLLEDNQILQAKALGYRG